MRSGPVFLAIGALLVIVGGAVFGATVLPPEPLTARAPQVTVPGSTALAVSRRVDPSVDRYLRTGKRRTALPQLTTAQTWLSRRARPLVAHDSDPTVSLNTTGWASSPDVTVYVNATGVNLFNASGRREAARWLVRRGKDPVRVDGWLMLDIRRPEARRWWLYGSDGRASCHPVREKRGALDLIACGYRGLWVDNVLTQPKQWFKPDPGIDAASWGAGLVALLGELRAGLPQGVPFVINGHWTDLDIGYSTSLTVDPAAPLVQAGAIADQLVIEGGAIDPGLDYAGALHHQWSYRRLLAYADAMHDAGVALQWEKTGSSDLTLGEERRLGALPSCRDGDIARPQPAWRTGDRVWQAHARTAAFNLASALLTFRPGDSVGDMCEYPGRGWRGYGQELGAPLADREDAGEGGLIVRRFAGGFVAVNPGDDPLPFAAPDGRAASDLADLAFPRGGAPAKTSFTVGPRAAVVARYPAS